MHGVLSLAIRTCLVAVLSLFLGPHPPHVEALKSGAGSPRVTWIVPLASGAGNALAPVDEFAVRQRAVPVSTSNDASTVVRQTDPSQVTVTG